MYRLKGTEVESIVLRVLRNGWTDSNMAPFSIKIAKVPMSMVILSFLKAPISISGSKNAALTWIECSEYLADPAISSADDTRFAK